MRKTVSNNETLITRVIIINPARLRGIFLDIKLTGLSIIRAMINPIKKGVRVKINILRPRKIKINKSSKKINFFQFIFNKFIIILHPLITQGNGSLVSFYMDYQTVL